MSEEFDVFANAPAPKADASRQAAAAKQKKFRRSITTANALKAGQEITYNDILFKRPGTGIPANKYKEIIGRHVNRDIEENKTLFWEDLVK